MKTKNIKAKNLKVGDKFIYSEDFICLKTEPCYITHDATTLTLCDSICIDVLGHDSIRLGRKNKFFSFINTSETIVKKIME